jgi:hypothetical protein
MKKSLPDAFLVRKADGVQVAKIGAIVKEESERELPFTALIYRFFAFS